MSRLSLWSLRLCWGLNSEACRLSGVEKVLLIFQVADQCVSCSPEQKYSPGLNKEQPKMSSFSGRVKRGGAKFKGKGCFFLQALSKSHHEGETNESSVAFIISWCLICSPYSHDSRT